MKLSILSSQLALSQADYIRHYHKLKYELALSAGEPEQLEWGAAVVNPLLAQLGAANCIYDAALAGESSPQEVIASVDAFFNAKGTTCLNWALNPSQDAQQAQPLADALVAAGYQRRTDEILKLSHMQPPQDVPQLQVLPGRAALRHVRQLAIARRGDETAQRVELALGRLDDPRYEDLTAMDQNQPVGRVAVLTVGDTGLVHDLYVLPDFRQKGIGRLLLARAIDICDRSQFKQVFLGIPESDQQARSFIQPFGFESVGQFVHYIRD